MMLQDTIRWFEVIQALILICVVSGVIVFYLLATPPKIRRLLRWHVVMISLSYVGAVTFMFTEILDRMNTPLTWRSWSAAPILSIGLAAMTTLIVHLVFSRRRFLKNNGNGMSGDQSTQYWEERIRSIMMEVVQDALPKLIAKKVVTELVEPNGIKKEPGQ